MPPRRSFPSGTASLVPSESTSPFFVSVGGSSLSSLDLSPVANFIHFPQISPAKPSAKKARPAKSHHHAGSGSQTDRGGLAANEHFPAIASSSPAGVSAHRGSFTGRDRWHAAAESSVDSTAASAVAPVDSISSPTLFAPVTVPVAADGYTPVGPPMSAWAMGSAAVQHQPTAIVPITTKKRYKTDDARAAAWKRVAADAEIAHVQRRRPHKDYSPTRQQREQERRREEARDLSPPDSAGIEVPYSPREIVRYLRPASRTQDLMAEAGPRSQRSNSISLKSLLQAEPTERGALSKTIMSLLEGSPKQKPLSRPPSGSLSGKHSGGSTPTHGARTLHSRSRQPSITHPVNSKHKRTDSQRSKKSSTPGGGSSRSSSGSQTPVRGPMSSIFSPTGRGMMNSLLSGRLETVTDDASADKTSAYYAIIQSATKRIQEYIATLEPDEEFELRAEYKRLGMSPEEIQAKMKRRQQAMSQTLRHHQHSTSSFVHPSSTDESGAPLLFAPFPVHSTGSSAQLTPSQYDKYRESFSTVDQLVRQMEKGEKEGLFREVSTFFSDKQKNDQAESRQLAYLESENQESEAMVDQSKKHIQETIKQKEMHTIAVLNNYYSQLKKSKKNHQNAVSQKSLANLRELSPEKKPQGSPPLGLSSEIDFLSFSSAVEEEPDSPISQALARVDFTKLNMLKSIPMNKRSSFEMPPPGMNMSASKSLPSSTSVGRLLGSSGSTASLRASEAMAALEEKLAGVDSSQAHELKLELLISMLQSQLSEQNAVLNLHSEALGPRKRAFEEKTAGLLKSIAERQQLLAEEEQKKKEVADECKRAEERIQHLTGFGSSQSMFASVQAERSAILRAREEKEEAFLTTLHADRIAMEDHAKEAEKMQAELNTRIGRMDAELAHVQKLREADRLKSKLIEKKMRKELILVLHGQIPPSLQKELAAEHELQMKDKRAMERMDGSEPIRVENGEEGAASIFQRLKIDAADRKEIQKSDSSGSDSDDDDSRHGSARPRKSSLHVRSPSLRNGLPGSRAASRQGSHPAGASSRSRQGTPSASTHRRAVSISTAQPAVPLSLNEEGLPTALLTLREGVDQLSAYRDTMLQQLEEEVKQLNELGVPLKQQGPNHARTSTMGALHEGEEGAEAAPGDSGSRVGSAAAAAAPKGRDKRRGSLTNDLPSKSPLGTPRSSKKKMLKRRSIPDAAGAADLVSAVSEAKLHAGSKKRSAKASPRSQKRSVEKHPVGASSRQTVSQSYKDKESNHHDEKSASHVRNSPKSKQQSKLAGAAKADPPSAEIPPPITVPSAAVAPSTVPSAGTPSMSPNTTAPATATPSLAAMAMHYANESRLRRQSFERRYSELLASPEFQPKSDDHLVVIDVDPATGKAIGAFTKKEMRAQTARFKAEIVEREKERSVMIEELTKLEEVHPKVEAIQAADEAQQKALVSLDTELDDLMSRVRALHLEANSHGLVVGDEITADDLAEHAIWAEDGYTGEAHIPTIDREDDWTPQWQVNEDARVAAAVAAREEQAYQQRLVQLKLENEKTRKAKADALTAAASGSPAATPRAGSLPPPLSPWHGSSHDVPPILSASEVAALAIELAEDDQNEEDETRIAKEAWEDQFREQYEEEVASAIAAKTARFTNKIVRTQSQLDQLRPTETQAQILREKIAKLESKVRAILKQKDDELSQAMAEAEVGWMAAWDAKKTERQQRRQATRMESKRQEALAIKADANRLKKEKRSASNSVSAPAPRRSALASRKHHPTLPTIVSPRASGQMATPRELLTGKAAANKKLAEKEKERQKAAATAASAAKDQHLPSTSGAAGSPANIPAEASSAGPADPSIASTAADSVGARAEHASEIDVIHSGGSAPSSPAIDGLASTAAVHALQEMRTRLQQTKMDLAARIADIKARLAASVPEAGAHPSDSGRPVVIRQYSSGGLLISARAAVADSTTTPASTMVASGAAATGNPTAAAPSASDFVVEFASSVAAAREVLAQSAAAMSPEWRVVDESMTPAPGVSAATVPRSAVSGVQPSEQVAPPQSRARAPAQAKSRSPQLRRGSGASVSPARRDLGTPPRRLSHASADSAAAPAGTGSPVFASGEASLHAHPPPPLLEFTVTGRVVTGAHPTGSDRSRSRSPAMASASPMEATDPAHTHSQPGAGPSLDGAAAVVGKVAMPARLRKGQSSHGVPRTAAGSTTRNKPNAALVKPTILDAMAQEEFIVSSSLASPPAAPFTPIVLFPSKSMATLPASRAAKQIALLQAPAAAVPALEITPLSHASPPIDSLWDLETAFVKSKMPIVRVSERERRASVIVAPNSPPAINILRTVNFSSMVKEVAKGGAGDKQNQPQAISEETDGALGGEDRSTVPRPSGRPSSAGALSSSTFLESLTAPAPRGVTRVPLKQQVMQRAALRKAAPKKERKILYSPQVAALLQAEQDAAQTSIANLAAATPASPSSAVPRRPRSAGSLTGHRAPIQFQLSGIVPAAPAAHTARTRSSVMLTAPPLSALHASFGLTVSGKRPDASKHDATASSRRGRGRLHKQPAPLSVLPADAPSDVSGVADSSSASRALPFVVTAKDAPLGPTPRHLAVAIRPTGADDAEIPGTDAQLGREATMPEVARTEGALQHAIPSSTLKLSSLRSRSHSRTPSHKSTVPEVPVLSASPVPLTLVAHAALLEPLPSLPHRPSSAVARKDGAGVSTSTLSLDLHDAAGGTTAGAAAAGVLPVSPRIVSLSSMARGLPVLPSPDAKLTHHRSMTVTLKQHHWSAANAQRPLLTLPTDGSVVDHQQDYLAHRRNSSLSPTRERRSYSISVPATSAPTLAPSHARVDRALSISNSLSALHIARLPLSVAAVPVVPVLSESSPSALTSPRQSDAYVRALLSTSSRSTPYLKQAIAIVDKRMAVVERVDKLDTATEQPTATNEEKSADETAQTAAV